MFRKILFASATLVAGCATVEEPPSASSGGISRVVQEAAQEQAAKPAAPTLKRKIALGRFTNVTRYGKSLLLPGEPDPIANQAADILQSRLAETGRFVVLDRPSLELAASTGAIELSSAPIVGVDAIVVGSVTQFGRKEEGQVGFLSSTKKQTAQAVVEARLVDAKSGLVFFTATGSGEASAEAGAVAGFGSRAAYDSTLNDKALSAAIADLMTGLVNRLEARRWSTDVLDVRPDSVLISGGPAQGLRIGDRFTVERRGQQAVSQSTGAAITLPGEPIAQIEVLAFFGDDDYAQGALTRVVAGEVASQTPAGTLRVVEAK